MNIKDTLNKEHSPWVPKCSYIGDTLLTPPKRQPLYKGQKMAYPRVSFNSQLGSTEVPTISSLINVML